MTNRALALALLLASCSPAHGAELPCDDGVLVTLTLRWRAPPGLVDSYRIYRTRVSGTYTDAPIVVTAPVASADSALSAPTAPGMKSQPYFFRMTAANAAGESVPSNEIASVPTARLCVPSAPQLLDIKLLLQQALSKVEELLGR